MDYTPAVLKNKGVPVQYCKVRLEDDSWVPVWDSEGELELEEGYVRFTHNIIADLEELWEGLPEWQEAMEVKPVSTLRRTLGLMLSEPLAQVGARMVEGRLAEYTNAVGVAWALANGVDPPMAQRLLEQSRAAVDSQMNLLDEQLEQSVNAMETAAENVATRGKKQSQSGAKSDTKGSKTSGKQAPPKS